MKFEAEINAAADEFGIDRAVLFALVMSESHFDPDVISRAGAVGLCQLMPGTGAGVAKLLVVNRPELAQRLGLGNFTTAMLKNPAVNAMLGAAYLRSLLDRYNQDLRLALMAYNGGPGAANRFLAGGTLPRETSNYWKVVSGRVAGYAAKLGTPGYTASTTPAPSAPPAPIQAGKDVQIVIPDNTAPAEPGVKGLFSRWFGK